MSNHLTNVIISNLQNIFKNQNRTFEKDKFSLQRRLSSATILDEESNHDAFNENDSHYSNQNDNNVNDEFQFNVNDNINIGEDNNVHDETDDNFVNDKNDFLPDDNSLDNTSNKNERVIYNLKNRLYSQQDDIDDILEWVSLKDCLNVSSQLENLTFI